MNRVINKATQQNFCNTNSSYPKFAPTIHKLSINNSAAAAYTVVDIIGENFLPPAYGNTHVNFGVFTNIPFIFYSTMNISFVVPKNAVPETYNVVAVNVYNNNFGSTINYRSIGSNAYSNSVIYTITT